MKIIVSIIIAVLIIAFITKKNSSTSTLVNSISSGWVEISDLAYNPIFQGYIIGSVPEENRMALVGVLIEDNCNPELIKAIKKGKYEYVEEGKILVRGFSDPSLDIMMSAFEGDELKGKISQKLVFSDEISPKLEIASEYISHVKDNDELFQKIWLSRKEIKRGIEK